MATTITISETTKAQLDELKIHSRQPYEELITKLILLANEHIRKGGEL